MLSGASRRCGMERISTGNEYLDKKLNGGLPRGTISCLVSSPASQCNPLFYSLISDHSWLYVTTYRSEAAVQDELDRTLAGDVRVEHVGVDRPMKNLNRVLGRLDTDRHVVVDTMNPFETKGQNSKYVSLLNGIKDYLLDTHSIALFHCTTDGRPPELRQVTLTMADVVLELEFVVDDVTTENLLTVPKYRSKETVDEVIKLDLGQDVNVDTSRNIA